MGLLSLTLPTIGEANATEDVDVRNALSAIQTVINGNIDGSNAPNIDAALARLIPITDIRGGTWVAGTGNGNYATSTATGATPTPLGTQGSAVSAIYFDPARHAVSGKTTKLVVAASLFTNAVNPAMSFTLGFWPGTITPGVSGGTSIFTPGASPTPNIISWVTPGANFVGQQTYEYTAPAAGWYALAATVGGGLTGGMTVTIISQAFVKCV